MKFSYMLAPLQDFTGDAFRALCHRHGADITFTEMIRIESLSKKDEDSLSRIDFKDSTPVAIQLLGKDCIQLRKFLESFSPHKGFSGFNINAGCPNPQVTSLGYGSFLLKKPDNITALIKTIRDFNYPVSVKMRLGRTRHDKEKKLYLDVLSRCEPDFFIVHARAGSEGYDVPADFSVYQECVKTGKTIVANGDIRSNEQISLLKDSGVSGAMIGRAAIENPQIFNELKGIPTVPAAKIREEYLFLAEKYNEPFRYRKNVFKRMK
ncbi:MAG: tRNA-dihydrouridine synthase family protein [Candidatus Woesearchaeota archaeon]|nr:tRNA-dihydrouridine synthase family protein [Candidatus Woesearchaeota archaeon]